MKKNITICALLCLFLSGFSQNPQTTISTWKNNAKGVYSFIHDDYGDFGVQGINNYADTIARNRGLKFTFGAITSACEGNTQMWTDAIGMIAYGHEIINHSHSHTCAVLQSGWCETGLWAEPATLDFTGELTKSTNLISTKTGSYPRYFIYPYDLFNDAANDFLKSLNYIGSRTGKYNGTESANFNPDVNGFFKTAFIVDVASGGAQISLSNLNSYVDQAITNGTWINREMHNVGTSGWGSITVANYRSHLNYLQSKVASNDLWVGTISEVLTYQIQKINFTPTTTYNAGQNKITITWNTPTFNVTQYLQALTVKSPVTLNVNLDGISSTGLKVFQNGIEISGVTVSAGIMQFNAYPTNGTITISTEACPDLCLLSNTSNQSVNLNSNASFVFSVISSNTITYAWYFNNQLIQYQTGSTLNLSAVQANQAGTYKVIASSNGKTLESSATLTVTEQKPYNTVAALIPGTVQFEHFDIGGQNVSYYDATPTNEGDATLRTEEVDIDGVIGGGHRVGYTLVGEWLEYTVNVFNSGSYTVKVRNASIASTGKIKLYLDGVAVSSTLSFTSSGGWDTFKTTSFSNIVLQSGMHTLRVEILGNDIDLDYMTFVVDNITSESEVEKSNSLNVYPNPFLNNFTLNFNSSNVSEIRIINLEGKLIETQTNIGNYNSITLGENLNSGIYFVEVVSATGTERVKVVKK